MRARSLKPPAMSTRAVSNRRAGSLPPSVRVPFCRRSTNQKLWSTGGDKADFMWLAVRTDPEAKKHAGISMLMVDLKSPGVTIRPSMALYGRTFSTQFYDNVRVPAKNMVGAVNNGWKVITDALAAERVMIGGTRMAGIERAFDHLTEYLKTAVVGGKALKNDPVIRDRIGALAADIEVARQFQMRNSRLVEQGKVPIHEAAMNQERSL